MPVEVEIKTQNLKAPIISQSLHFAPPCCVHEHCCHLWKFVLSAGFYLYPECSELTEGVVFPSSLSRKLLFSQLFA